MAVRLSGFLLLLLPVLLSGVYASRPAINQELSNLFNELWRLDVNRMKPGIDYTISVQGRAGFVNQGSHVVVDHASLPLFSNVNESKLSNTTTFSLFMKLLDNYERSTGITERVTPEELTEINLFLDAVLETQVMKELNTDFRGVRVKNKQLEHLCAAVECKVGLHDVPNEDRWKYLDIQYLICKTLGSDEILDSSFFRGEPPTSFLPRLSFIQLPIPSDQLPCLYRGKESPRHDAATTMSDRDARLRGDRAHQYLVSKGKSNSDSRQFKNQLNLIWFHLYHRQRNTGPDSCGFEHVFVGETKSGTEIIGFHNWVQFFLQEKNSHLDYKGYKARINDLPDQDDHVLNLQFSWHGVVKPVGSAFIGTSPEFEMAIFTIIFLMNTERSTTVAVNIDQCQMELVVVRQGRCLGTAYPKLLSSNSRHVGQNSH